ncbi:MAG: ATP synthase F1 subunit epsilon [Armatimonadetes bacterium]|nr:ATP synthase F1 subunit epsilon [Armatimonadota bacterium]MBX3108641.1 ATP synthase F1 subunit epsilon [Fimbriimonadaceae bacterium]
MANFTLSVVAPDRTVFEGEVKNAVVPAVLGYLGIWAGHEPSLVALKAGLIQYTDSNGQDHWISVGGGFLETSGAGVIVLAQDVTLSGEVDLASAEATLEEARRTLRGESTGMTLQEAMAEYEKALARRELAVRK